MLLQIIVYLAGALVTHDLLSTIRLHSLHIGQNRCDSISKSVEALVHLLLLLRVEANRLRLYSTMRIVLRELRIGGCVLAIVLRLILLRSVKAMRMLGAVTAFRRGPALLILEAMLTASAMMTLFEFFLLVIRNAWSAPAAHTSTSSRVGRAMLIVPKRRLLRVLLRA